MKKYLFLFAALVSLTFVSCEDSGDGTVDGAIELASPTPSASTDLATATITWSAISKCEGYAYSLDEGDDKEVDATVLSAQFSSLSSGNHSFTIRALGDDIDTEDSQDRTIYFDIDPALPAPVVNFEVNSLSSLTISWSAVASAEGYNYKFNDANDWTSTTELSAQFDNLNEDVKYSFEIYAIGNGSTTADSGSTKITVSTQDTSVGLWVRMQNGESHELIEGATDIYEATIACNATDSFTILIEGDSYGFTPYSGNGGIGTVQNIYATVPYYNDKSGGYDNVYYVEKSVGQLSTIGENEGQNLWINITEGGEFTAKVDLSYSDGTPRYRIDLVKDTDNILLEQNFDLMVYGGEWVQYSSGRYASGKDRDLISNNIDGTEVATATASYTTLGMWITKDDYTEAYLANRDMTGWYIDECFEFPGYFRLSTSSTTTTYFGVLKTPTLAKLTNTADIQFSFDGVRFASEGDIKVYVVQGGGTLTNVNVDIEGNGTPTPITVDTDDNGNSYFMITSTHCPKHGNADPKPWSSFTATISGATSATQVVWDCSYDTTVASSTVRLCIDNILITK